MQTNDEGERIDAVTETPNGAEIRLIYSPSNSSERVEIEREGDTVVLASCPAGKLVATKIYNNTVDPFVDDNGHPLHGN
jgi:hypothetical protein